jgi:hypothetical protein
MHRALSLFALMTALCGVNAAARAGEEPLCVAPPEGLVSWWPGESDATDIQGANDGTLENGASFGASRVGNGFALDGVDDFVSVPDDASLTPQTFTLSAWFRSAGAVDPVAAFLVARSGPTGMTGYELGARPNAGGVLRFTLNGGASGADLAGTTNVLDDVLHHVAASYDGAVMRIYLDGALEAELEVSVAMVYPAGSPLTIGRRELNGISGLWTGIVDEVQLFAGRALCASEVAAIVSAGSAGQCADGEQAVCLDSFLCYKAKPTKGGPGFAARNATLSGPFEPLTVAVQKPATLCLPAQLDGTPAGDSATHLEGYKAKPSVKPLRPAGLSATTAFGTHLLDTLKVDRLLVPTAKSLTKPLVGPGDTQVDAFECYTVKASKGSPKFPKGTQADIADQFEAARTFDLKKPKHLCLPVGLDGGDVEQPAARLLCYPAKPATGEPRHQKRTGVFLANAFGSEQSDTIKEAELCVPAALPLPQ